MIEAGESKPFSIAGAKATSGFKSDPGCLLISDA